MPRKVRKSKIVAIVEKSPKKANNKENVAPNQQAASTSESIRRYFTPMIAVVLKVEPGARPEDLPTLKRNLKPAVKTRASLRLSLKAKEPEISKKRVTFSEVVHFKSPLKPERRSQRLENKVAINYCEITKRRSLR